jgi:hypothetical protein
VLENHAVYRLRLGDKVDVPRLTTHWQTPAPDAATCNTHIVKEDRALIAAAPISSDNGVDLPADSGKLNKGAEGKKKPDEIPVVRKEKPDNRTAWPSC